MLYIIIIIMEWMPFRHSNATSWIDRSFSEGREIKSKIININNEE